MLPKNGRLGGLHVEHPTLDAAKLARLERPSGRTAIVSEKSAIIFWSR